MADGNDGFIDCGTLSLAPAESDLKNKDAASFHEVPEDAAQSSSSYRAAGFAEGEGFGFPSASAFVEAKLAQEGKVSIGDASVAAAEEEAIANSGPNDSHNRAGDETMQEAFEALFVSCGASGSGVSSAAALPEQGSGLENRLPNFSSLEEAEAMLKARTDLSQARAALPASVRAMMEEGIRAVVTSASADDATLAKLGLVGATAGAPAGAKETSLGTPTATATAMAMQMKIASAQLHPEAGDVAANTATVIRLLEACAESSIDLLIFPETWLQAYHIGGFLMRDLAIAVPSTEELARHLHLTEGSGEKEGEREGLNPILRLCAACKRTGVSLVIPFAELAPSSCVFNTSILVDGSDRSGAIRQHYRKTHLWRFNGYEGSLFEAGPGPALVGGCSDEQLKQGPFWPVTLSRFPHIPIGLLVCFDIEFPEPARRYALRGAKLIIASMASGDCEGFSSERIVPTRAAENHCVVVYSNYPSTPLAPLPRASEERLQALRGSAASGAPAAAIATEPLSHQKVAYAGSTTICDPKGRFLVKMPSYVCTNNEEEKARRTKRGWLVIDGEKATEAEERLTSVEKSEKYFLLEESIALTKAAAASLSSLSGLGADEAVVAVAFNPFDPAFASDEERNPYLQEVRKRSDLYGEC